MKPFLKLTAAQKRVAIAKDVLKQLDLRRYKPTPGEYWSLPGSFYDKPQDVKIDQKLLRTGVRCEVCGVGSAILSGIRLFNRCSIPHSWNFDDARTAIAKWFSEQQSAMIELAFERHLVLHSSSVLTLDEYNSAREFSQSTCPITRLRAIFTNIIANKGTFRP